MRRLAAPTKGTDGRGRNELRKTHPMHNLHLLLVRADSAEDAAGRADTAVSDWGDTTNWRVVGGIASDDGSDDIENHGDAGWGLSFLDETEGITRKGTYFSRAVAYLHQTINGPVTLISSPHTTHPDLRSAINGLGDLLKGIDIAQGQPFDDWSFSRNLKYLSQLDHARQAMKNGQDIPAYYSWQLDNFGLTDLSELFPPGTRRYLVMLDMHS